MWEGGDGLNSVNVVIRYVVWEMSPISIKNNRMGNDPFVDAAESASFPLPGTGKREGGEKKQPLHRFPSHLGISKSYDVWSKVQYYMSKFVWEFLLKFCWWPEPSLGGVSWKCVHTCNFWLNIILPYSTYGEVQPDFTAEIEVFYMPFERCGSKNRKRSNSI